jgi:hypothetical protein
MKKFNHIILGLAVLAGSTMLSSCLKSGLDELPAFDGADITDINFEYRFEDSSDKWTDGANTVKFVKLGITKEIKKAGESGNANDLITASLTIPPPSGSFTREERQKVSLDNLVAYAYLSTAATIEPLDGAPILGAPGNFSAERKYKVTAADGKTSKIWTVKVNPLPVINQYEGLYHATGHFDHPTSPRDINLDKYMLSVDAFTITGAHSDLGGGGYTITIKVNPDHSVNVKQFTNGSEIGEMVPGAENKYNPASKTFTLHYRYSGGGGWRTINETLVLK